jgi:sugar lactone lactonase YvrE
VIEIVSDVQCIWNGQAVLGEGPVWDVAEQALFWVDIKKHTIHRPDPRKGPSRHGACQARSVVWHRITVGIS